MTSNLGGVANKNRFGKYIIGSLSGASEAIFLK
jgi:hypothetical protein